MSPEQKEFQNCAHCAARLRRNADSTVCRKCRFQGHKEFGECDKCGDLLTIED